MSRTNVFKMASTHQKMERSILIDDQVKHHHSYYLTSAAFEDENHSKVVRTYLDTNIPKIDFHEFSREPGSTTFHRLRRTKQAVFYYFILQKKQNSNLLLSIQVIMFINGEAHRVLRHKSYIDLLRLLATAQT